MTWTHLADSLSWAQGHTGAGYLLHDGTIKTWSVDPYHPLDQSAIHEQNHEFSPIALNFEIDPDGGIVTDKPTQKVHAIIDADSRLYDAGQRPTFETDWNLDNFKPKPQQTGQPDLNFIMSDRQSGWKWHPPHRNRWTGRLCDCGWGQPRHRTAAWHFGGPNFNKVLKAPDKAYKTPEGQAFLQHLKEINTRDEEDAYDSLMPYIAQRWKKGDIRHVNDGDRGHLQYLQEPEQTFTRQVRNPDYLDTPQGLGRDPSVPRWLDTEETVPARWGQVYPRLPNWHEWYEARNHPTRQGVNVMDPNFTPLDMQRATAAHQKALEEGKARERWVQRYAPHANVVHTFGPEAGSKYKGWNVVKLDRDQAEGDSEALGHCIGQDGQPYKHNIDIGNIDAYSLRDAGGYPHVSWHFNPSGRDIGHMQGASGDPNPAYRDLMSKFHAAKGLPDEESNHEDELEPEYDRTVDLPDRDTMEDYVEQENNPWDYAEDANIGEDTEINPGTANWHNIAQDYIDGSGRDVFHDALRYNDWDRQQFVDALRQRADMTNTDHRDAANWWNSEGARSASDSIDVPDPTATSVDEYNDYVDNAETPAVEDWDALANDYLDYPVSYGQMNEKPYKSWQNPYQRFHEHLTENAGDNDNIGDMHQALQRNVDWENEAHQLGAQWWNDAMPQHNIYEQPQLDRDWNDGKQLKMFEQNPWSQQAPFTPWQDVGVNGPSGEPYRAADLPQGQPSYVTPTFTSSWDFTSGWDPTICEGCGSPMSEPKQVNGRWMNHCTHCGLWRKVPNNTPLLQQQQQNWPPYPDLMQSVAPDRPWVMAASDWDFTSSELHVGLAIPDPIRKRIRAWVDEQDWPEGTELEDPSEYHITLMYSPDGHDEHKDADWMNHSHGVNVRVTGVDQFGDDKPAIVLRIDSPAAKTLADDMQTKAEDHDLEISRFPGGYKPHITVAYGPGKPKGPAPEVSFKTGPSSVSPPRESAVDDHHILAPAVELREWLADFGASEPPSIHHDSEDDFVQSPAVSTADDLPYYPPSEVPKELKQSSGDARYYHISPKVNRESIQQNGLWPREPEIKGIEPGEGGEAGVYMFDNPQAFSPQGIWPGNEHQDIWEVDPKGLYLDRDEAAGMDGSWYSPYPIPANQVRLASDVSQQSAWVDVVEATYDRDRELAWEMIKEADAAINQADATNDPLGKPAVIEPSGKGDPDYLQVAQCPVCYMPHRPDEPCPTSSVAQYKQQERSWYNRDPNAIHRAPDGLQDHQTDLGKLASAPQDINGSDLQDLAGTPVPVNQDGTISLYHATDEQAANALASGQPWQSREGREIYFSTHPNGGDGFGTHAVQVDVPPHITNISDAFRNGEVHTWIDSRHLRPEHFRGVTPVDPDGRMAKLAWTTIDDDLIVPEEGDEVDGAIVDEMDNLTTHLEDGRALSLDQVEGWESEGGTVAKTGSAPALVPDLALTEIKESLARLAGDIAQMQKPGPPPEDKRPRKLQIHRDDQGRMASIEEV